MKDTKKYSNKKTIFTAENIRTFLLWLPVYCTLLVLPWVTHYKLYLSRLYKTPYYVDDIYNYDFSLYYKQIFFFFIIGAMVFLLPVIMKKKSIKQEFGKQRGIWIALAIYLFFAFLSSVCSDYRLGAFTGSDSHFQGFFALLGYGVLTVYLHFLIQTEKDVKIAAIGLIIASFLQSALGIFQYAGFDLHDYMWYQELITPEGYLEAVGPVTNRMKDMVALGANNPNYAGVLVAMLLSLVLGLILTERKFIVLGAEAILAIALFVVLLGTGSEAGLFIFIAVAVVAVIFRLRKLLKRWYIIVPAFAAVAVIFLFAAKYAQLSVFDNIKNALTITKEEPNPLSRMVTGPDGIEITYRNVSFTVKAESTGVSYRFWVEDESGKEYSMQYSDEQGYYYLEDEVLNESVLKLGGGAWEGNPLLVLDLNNHVWQFVLLKDTGYFMINPYGHLEELIETRRFGFIGYERLASNRGLIWSQTLPLLKDTVILGVGPNNFIHLYPQNNYKDIYYYNGEMQVTSKPHNMYLQIAVETGVVSLIALLVFWCWYAIQSMKIYWSCEYDTLTKKLGFACFLAVIAYLGCGLTNDAMITVAPVFWCVQGLGLVLNKLNTK